MKKIEIEVNEDVLLQAVTVLDNNGLDVAESVRMFLKAVAREGTIAFLLSQAVPSATVKNFPAYDAQARIEMHETERKEMKKTTAINLLKERGNHIDKCVTYSSRNKTTYNFWANPNFSVLDIDWSFILNDWKYRKIYLFKIPAGAILKNKLVPRNDQKNLIDIQILDGVPGFIDKRSEFSFKQFLVDEVEY